MSSSWIRLDSALIDFQIKRFCNTPGCVKRLKLYVRSPEAVELGLFLVDTSTAQKVEMLLVKYLRGDTFAFDLQQIFY